MQEEISNNKMASQHVAKLMFTMGVPIVLSMILQACYNIVDSVFVARMPDMEGIKGAGEYAVNALTLAFPVQMLIVAFGIGTGIGVGAVLSMNLGQNNKENVGKTAGNGIFLAAVIYILFFLFGIFGIDTYLNSQTKDLIIKEMAVDYLRICLFASFGIILFSVYEKLLQATGKTVLSTAAQIAGAVTNIVLDPILIFGYLGFPQMGIKGAAYATIIGQIVSMLAAAFFHYGKNREVPAKLVYFKPDLKIIKAIYGIGFPAIIMQALMSFMTYGVNIIFGAVSLSAVTAYGIFYKIQQFLFFAGFGLRDAITPIVSFNYGMGSAERVKSGIKYGILYVQIIMLAGIVVLEIFAEPLVHVFGLSAGTAGLCVSAIRIISLGFLFAGMNIALQGVFQALNDGAASLVVSLLRLCIVVLPLAWWFSTWNSALKVMWWAFPIAELVACIAAVCFFIRRLKRVLRQI